MAQVWANIVSLNLLLQHHSFASSTVVSVQDSGNRLSDCRLFLTMITTLGMPSENMYANISVVGQHLTFAWQMQVLQLH